MAVVVLAVEAVASMEEAPVVSGAVADPAGALVAREAGFTVVPALVGAAFVVVVPVGAADRAAAFIVEAAAGAVVAGGAAPVGVAGVILAMAGAPVMAGATVSGAVLTGAAAGAGAHPLRSVPC
ncbi:hypothetical protein AA14362_2235 [Acetobacter cerevisiae DSM 14362]|nr:hypothetical protein AA14362_2235 [Acetobacter cerevisiae DSM 14362]